MLNEIKRIAREYGYPVWTNGLPIRVILVGMGDRYYDSSDGDFDPKHIDFQEEIFKIVIPEYVLHEGLGSFGSGQIIDATNLQTHPEFEHELKDDYAQFITWGNKFPDIKFVGSDLKELRGTYEHEHLIEREDGMLEIINRYKEIASIPIIKICGSFHIRNDKIVYNDVYHGFSKTLPRSKILNGLENKIGYIAIDQTGLFI